MKDNIISINNLHYFNAHTRSAEDVVNTFIARKQVLKELEDGLDQETVTSIPQHYMIIGSRGMGKSTLLRRLEISIRSGKFNKRFIPILFPEEQYNIDRLSKFWLNSLDALADSLESESNFKEADAMDQLIKALGNVRDENELSSLAFDALIGISKRLGRRMVFLIDNIDLLFEGISSEEQFRLRKIITSNGGPIFISASTHNPADSQDYDAAFYDAFDNIYLERLSQMEMRELLLFLAEKTGKSDAIDLIYQKTGQLDALHSLTGGNPRIAVFMFQMIVNGFSSEIFENLNALLDIITPLYKSNFEQLSKQAQIIVDALALNWDPCNLDMLSKITKLENNQLSAQIERLVKSGWIERASRFSEEKNIVLTKVKNFIIRERFFNIWYIMRRASRRQRGDLRSLTCFLETFYTPAHLNIEKARIVELLRQNLDSDKVTYGLALSKAFTRDEENAMEKEIFGAILMHTEGDLEKIAKYLNPEIIPTESYVAYLGKEAKKYIQHITTKIDAEDFEGALEFIESLMSTQQEDSWLWMKYGQCLAYLNRFDEAEVALKHSLNIDNNSTYTWGLLADAYLSLGHEDKAEATYLEGLKTTGEYEYLSFRFSNFLRDKERIDEATELLANSISTNPGYKFNYSALVSLMIRKGDNTKAKELIDVGLTLFPDFSTLWYSKGILYWKEDLEKAVESFEKATTIDPGRYYHWWYYGKVLTDAGRFAEAKKSFQRALEINNGTHRLWIEYGTFLFELDEYSAAIKAIKKAIDIEATSNAWGLLGKLYSLKGSFREAEKAFKKSIRLDKENYDSTTLIGSLYHFIYKDFNKALKWYLSSLNINSNQYDTWVRLGEIYKDGFKDYQNARQAYQKAFSFENPNADDLSGYLFLLRDIMNLYNDAKAVLEANFEILSKSEIVMNVQLAMFAQADRNMGIAESHWKIALSKIVMSEFGSDIDLFVEAAALTHQSGYGKELLKIFEDTETNHQIRPIYEALKALEIGNVNYLLNVAPEISETAKNLYADMKAYQIR